MDIQGVLQSFDADLVKTDTFMREVFRNHTPLLSKVLDYVLSSGGKRFRPLLLLISAAMFGCQSERRFALAAVVELIHTATLLHDDVIDEASLRRNQESANKKWGNAVSVLSGDFLLSQALVIMTKNGDAEIVHLAATAIGEMAEGEILQLTKCGRADSSPEDYFRIIAGKTAALTAAACGIGARIGQAPPQVVESFVTIGKHIGMAFQLVDDALDYNAETAAWGKEAHKDLNEGKLTLPLLHTLKKATNAEKEFITNSIAAGGIADIKELLVLVEKYNGVAYTMDVARSYLDTVTKMLEAYEASMARDALLAIAQYALTRKQ